MVSEKDKKIGMQLSMLVNMRSTDAILEEVKYNFIHFYPAIEFEDVRKAYKDFLELFNGKYPGYRRCNTRYHDKVHTTDTLVAISRLIDGYNLTHTRKLSMRKVKIALVSTLFHDSGFVQSTRDKKGTGAKYTIQHIERSIVFIKKYFARQGFGTSDFNMSRNMISCTGLTTDASAIKFSHGEEKILGCMLGTADLVGQMADRTYLEKLLLLYHEFREGRVPGYNSELHLLQKTMGFYRFVAEKLATGFLGVDKYMKPHFSKRYGISKDLYKQAINNHKRYLEKILIETPEQYRDKLRRKLASYFQGEQ